MRKNYLLWIVSILLCASLLLSSCNQKKTESLKPRVTASQSTSEILTGESAEQFQVYPNEDFQYGLYRLTLEIDHTLTITHYVITSFCVDTEQIEQSWIDGDYGDYTVDTNIIEDKIIDGQIAAVAQYSISSGKETIMADHINFVMDSVFNKN